MTKLASFNNLQLSLDGKAILNSITTSVNEGDVIGVLGLNGAGKTTLIESLLGFIYTSPGQIELFGGEPQKMTNATKQNIGFVPQKDELPPSLKAKQYVDLISTFYNNFDSELAQQLLIDWNIDQSAKVSKLSVGQRQKLSIISAIAHHPQLLVLDEPVASLDPLARREFLQTIAGIACEPSNAVIFSTHIVSDLERVANRVWMIKNGTLLLDMPLDTLKETLSVFEFDGSIDSAPFEGELARRISLGNTRVCIENKHTEQIIAASRSNPRKLDLSLEDLMLEIHA